MSSSANMLRTRRKDTNVKPNRRLDRKSSRGMIFENEELRLKTININAEVERGQNDIKKLKRENDQLRREIWYLRDEYDKLDKLLRMKQLQYISSSSTSCSSDSDSCSSCTEETEEIEMSQNLANVQKTSMGNFHKEFDHLSVVPEENSAENSERNSSSNRGSSCNDQWDKDVIKPDQSYPYYENLSSKKDSSSNSFFPQILPNQHYEEASNNQFLGLEQPNQNLENDQLHLNLCVGQNLKNSLQSGRENLLDNSLPQLLRQNMAEDRQKFFGIRYYENLSFYDNEADHFSNLENANRLPILEKSGTDLIAKTDNKDFVSQRSHSSFSNGGNLEELLNDIETISQDILKISNVQKRTNEENENENYNETLNVEHLNFHVAQNHTNERKSSLDTQDSSYKSQLNLIVMPTPMPLIGVEKYKQLQRSCESLGSQTLDNLSASKSNLKILDETLDHPAILNQELKCSENVQPFVPVPPLCPGTSAQEIRSPNINQMSRPRRPDTPPKFSTFKGGFSPLLTTPEITSGLSQNGPDLSSQLDIKKSPFYFGNYENQAFSLENIQEDLHSINICSNTTEQIVPSGLGSLLTAENDENQKIVSQNAEKAETVAETKPETKPPEETKTPKLSIRRKVSIHFKGKKDKKNQSQINVNTDSKPPSGGETKKSPFFDIKFQTELKNDKKATPKLEPKTPNVEPKTPTSADSKCSTGENKNSTCDTKSSNSDPKASSGEQKSLTPNGETKDGKTNDQKQRKSSSASPEHGKHKHGKGDSKKCHKKHKKSEKLRHRKGSLTTDRILRERSFSVCTDRSLDHRLGLGYGFGLYDDLSDNRSSDSSCDSNMSKSRKISVISNVPSSGKIPWCGCWGNGCL
ncbi:uncharacterized protein LOC108735892 [Agrilus planipennis]|uniref:Uncharacterized protein LOC108735892 n=1 Tax=Agrilus planipennis TaxID=224129 RepID=A0A1W4WSY9_AGRPL|nr:uncharacterized protein LOC108735892 [Agrilus planipennis]